jgi:hypothetical protein
MIPLPSARLAAVRYSPYLQSMNLDLTDEETAALTQELHEIVENDRYPFSPRIRTLKGILAKLRPSPVMTWLDGQACLVGLRRVS